MLERIRLQNFRVVREAEIDLERLTVLVGPNGSGKTTVLQGLQILTDMSAFSRDFASRKQLAAQRSQHTDSPLLLELEGSWEGSKLGASLTYGNARGNAKGAHAGNELLACAIQGDHRIEVKKSSGGVLGDQASFHSAPIWRFVSPARIVHFEAEELARPSAIQQQVPGILPNGAGLASTLVHLAATSPQVFPIIEQGLCAVVPSVKRFRLNPLSGSGATPLPYEVRFETTSGEVPASAISEGTLLVLGYLTVLHAPERPRLLLVENIERGLHPRAMGDLIGQLRAILERFPNIQIIATSHSPYLVDHLKPEEVRLTSIGPDGLATCAALNRHPDFDRWKDEMAPGEFWSAVGEDWVSEQTGPAHA